MANYKGKTLKYILLPGIISRLRDLLTTSFASSAYFIAIIYQTVRLLPRNHPYLNPENIGKFGLRHVIAEAANNLTFSLKNADQIIVFFTILIGILLLITQFILLFLALLSYQPALADESVTNVIRTFWRSPDQNHQDLTMILLDRIFGIPDMFKSCISVIGTACKDLNGYPMSETTIFPTPFHMALRSMLAFYAHGLFFVGVIIILYFVAVIVSETAASGTPFGQRYNKTWIPARIILFFALLVPLSAGNTGGLNLAQIITFQAAKMGSSFASNGWDIFNNNVTGATSAGRYNMVAQTEIPPLNDVAQFIYLAKTCKAIEETFRPKILANDAEIPKYGPDGIQAYVIRPVPILFEEPPAGTTPDPNALLLQTTSFQAALDHTNNAPIIIRFGSHITDKNHPDYNEHVRLIGNVNPVCGDLLLEVQNITNKSDPSYEIQEAYFNLIQMLWDDTESTTAAQCFAKFHFVSPNECSPLPGQNFRNNYTNRTKEQFDLTIKTLIQQQALDGSRWNIPEHLSSKGWAGAAVWYNRIAELNGKVTDSVLNMPKIKQFPFIMEYVARQKMRTQEDVLPEDQFNPIGADITYNQPGDERVAPRLNDTYQEWQMTTGDSLGKRAAQSPFLNFISAIFGAHGIYEMIDNQNVNPMAQLSALGKGMMNATVRNVGVGFGVSLLGGKGDNAIKSIAKLTGNFAQAVGYMSLTISVTLFYVLPLMPFIYFFFAVSGWIKSIFEAIVGVPLWALAHIAEWGGEGIAGPAANNGYMLIFEIFLRPILILFGLIASITTFSALVMVLNDVFDLVLNNLAGAGGELKNNAAATDIASMMRGPIDELFFTIVYVIIVYMIGLAAFKLVDAIPNTILRWMGFTAKTFQESTQNAAEELSGKAYRGTTMAGAKLSGTSLSGTQLNVLFQ